MAVFTRLEKNEIDAVLHKAGLPPCVSFEEIKEGWENSTYLVRSASDAPKPLWVLSLIERVHSKAHLEWQVGLMTRAQESGLPVPAPFVSENGVPYVRGLPALIVEYRPSCDIASNFVQACEKGAQALAKLHMLDYAPKFDFWITPRALLSEWEGNRKIYRTQDPVSLPPNVDQQAIAGWLERAEPLIEALKKDWEIFADLAPSLNLPKSPIHGDYFPDNVLFNKKLNKKVNTRSESADSGLYVEAIIDFAYCCTYYSVYDLAIALSAWGFNADGTIDPVRYDAFLNAYNKQRALNADERRFLPLFCRLAAFRFFSTRLKDLFFVHKETPKDPDEYLKKLEFFTLSRSE